MSLNLPNKLTILRILIIPIYVYAMLVGFVGDRVSNNYIAASIFIIAALTDTLDGYIARKYNLITNFGKFMDPLADKLLVCAALICFVELALLPAWVVIIIISREFIVTGFRLIASDANIVISASIWGKFKTISQMLMVVFIMGMTDNEIFVYIKDGLVFLTVALTILSAVDYIIKNKQVLKN